MLKKIRLIMKATSKESKSRSGIKESKVTQMNILTSRSKSKFHLHYVLISWNRKKESRILFLHWNFRLIL